MSYPLLSSAMARREISAEDQQLIKLFSETDAEVAKEILARVFQPGTALAVLDILRERICSIAPHIREQLVFPLSEKEALDSIRKRPHPAV